MTTIPLSSFTGAKLGGNVDVETVGPLISHRGVLLMSSIIFQTFSQKNSEKFSASKPSSVVVGRTLEVLRIVSFSISLNSCLELQFHPGGSAQIYVVPC